MAPPPSPLAIITNLRREELPMALSMAAYFFFVITTFWILKPIKKAQFIQFYDQRSFSLFGLDLRAAQAELVAKVLNMFVAYAAVVAFSQLSARFRRERLTNVLSGFFAVTLVIYSLLLDGAGAPTVWTFYLYGDLYSTLMVAAFFAFLNDSVSPEASKRTYGLVVLGGVLGGVFGTSTLGQFIGVLPRSAWMWVCLGVSVLIVVVANVAGRWVRRSTRDEEQGDATSEPAGNPAIDGARLVLRSRYLLSIVTIVGVYEIVSTVMDFQFSSTVSHYVDGPAIGEHFARVFQITNIVSMVVQVFVTGFVMTRFPLTVALLILPLATAIASLSFMAVPVLWIGSLLNTADNGLSYSVNQSAKEALYTPTTREEKYRAKAFIDMFVQRLAKAIAVFVSLGITVTFTEFSTVRWLGGATIALALLWVTAARYAGHRFQAMTEPAPAQPPGGA